MKVVQEHKGEIISRPESKVREDGKKQKPSPKDVVDVSLVSDTGAF